MLSYRHAFHAGNQADVLKHAVLSIFLQHYTQKEKPFTAFDIHAGKGFYYLNSDWAQQTGEAQRGILALLEKYKDNLHNKAIPDCIKNYLTLCLSFYSAKGYPGSPEIIKTFLRENDRLILSDLQNDEIEFLKMSYKQDKRIHIHKRDGFEALKALTPPRPLRGFTLFDPSYEVTSDYQKIITTTTKVHAKWPTGIFLIWYPLVERRRRETDRLKAHMASLPNTELLTLEIATKNKTETAPYGLQGSGMMLSNPPWKISEKLVDCGTFLAKEFDCHATITHENKNDPSSHTTYTLNP